MSDALISDDRARAARAVRIEDVAQRHGVKLRREGKELVGPCPRCGGDDRFAINVKKQLWNCRGCGRGGDVIDLVEHLDSVDFTTACTTLLGAPPKPNGRNHVIEAKKIVVERFDYTNEGGDLLFQVERIEFQKPDGSFVLENDEKRKKSFRQRRPDPEQPGKWLWDVAGVSVVPYRLPELVEAIATEHAVLVVEGERKVDLLRSWNVPATCCAGGAKKWKPEHSQYLRGADVIIVPDNDRAGREHLDAVATSLRDIADSIRVLELPGVPVKGDIVDWVTAGGTVERLHDLIARARPWTPNQIDEPRRQKQPGNIEDDVALAFAAEHAKDFRHVAKWNRWMSWHGGRWQNEDTLAAFDEARTLCRGAGDAKAKTVAAVITLARADRAMAATEDQWDVGTTLFNMPTKETR